MYRSVNPKGRVPFEVPLRSPAEIVEDRIRGGNPCRCVGGFEAKAQPRRAVESVTAAGPLDEADDTVGRDPVIWAELDDATRRAELETTDTEPGGTLPQPVDDEQRARRRRQRAETIDQLGLEVVETLAVGGTRHALVELQSQVHVRDVILRQQGGQLQVDFAAGRGRRVERRLPAFAQGSHRALEKLEVEAETDLLDLSGLFLAEQLAGAANLEVLGREREARTEVLQGLDSLEPLARVLGQGSHGRGEEVRECAVMGAADAAAQLVQLCEAEAVGAVDQDRVGGRHVDAGLDDGRADEDLESAVIEIEHQLL